MALTMSQRHARRQEFKRRARLAAVKRGTFERPEFGPNRLITAADLPENKRK